MNKKDFDLPMYYFFGERPVKIVDTVGGGLAVLAYNWGTGDFEDAPDDYFSRAISGYRDEERVTEEEFEQQVKKLRAKLGKQ